LALNPTYQCISWARVTMPSDGAVLPNKRLKLTARVD
jgi:hypothetical protein